jgi:Histidine kinase-, DNA gyrase B-, and HSP90-like ATPase
VTSARRAGTPAAVRKRQQRDRECALIFEHADWALFLDPATLPQKAGCQPENLRQIVLRELVDNALDAGAHVTLQQHEEALWIVTDDGPGLDPAEVPLLFSVNRPLLSSKRRRLPLRGMLGNGLRVVAGAVAASEGWLAVATRGHRLTLAVDPATGTTKVNEDRPVPFAPGLSVSIILGSELPHGRDDDDHLARQAIEIARHGVAYRGPSSPWWYSPRDLYLLMQQVTPADTSVPRLCHELGFTLDDDRIARTLDRDEAATVLEQLRGNTKPIEPKSLGAIGPTLYDDAGYACHTGIAWLRGARIPFVAEAWAGCERAERRGVGSATLRLLLNRTPSVATIIVAIRPGGLVVLGCGLQRSVPGPRPADYDITISVIAPYIELATDGKEPALEPFSGAIATVLRKACRAAYRAMGKPPGGMSIKDAAWQVMPEAYCIASANGTLPANARQIMYAARPAILSLTGKKEFTDSYFTQVLLPDYVEEHIETTTADWDVVFDDRGSFIEPHTGRVVPLGTVEVRQYLGERSELETPASIDPGSMFENTGPLNRYRDILFIEKEGFSALVAHALIAERFDIGIMSTKGMSVTAARMLLDRLAPHIDRVFVLHDFDVSGFSIFGTLGTSSRRYRFHNKVRIADLGLRLADIHAMGLESEPYTPSGWAKRVATLQAHGATPREISLLRTKRVELNAMPSDVFVLFLERKLTEHGVHKVVPAAGVLESHARRVIIRTLLNMRLDDIRPQVDAAAARVELPSDLRQQVEAMLRRRPDIPWDLAVADIARGCAPHVTRP